MNHKMIGEKINENYRYENAQLTSARVNADKVTIENNKVSGIENARAYIDNDTFYFTVYKKNNDTLGYNVNNVTAGVDAMAIINEFIAFVENDVAPIA